jgi:hypothetical protein
MKPRRRRSVRSKFAFPSKEVAHRGIEHYLHAFSGLNNLSKTTFKVGDKEYFA